MKVGRSETRKRRADIYLCTQGFIHPAGVKPTEAKAGLGMVHRLDKDYEFPEGAIHTMATRYTAQNRSVAWDDATLPSTRLSAR